MEEPKKYYTHTIVFGKERPEHDKKLIDFLQSGRPVFIDLKSGQIIDLKNISQMKTFELEQPGFLNILSINDLNTILKESKRLYLSGFLHYKKTIYLIDARLKEIEYSIGQFHKTRRGNYGTEETK